MRISCPKCNKEGAVFYMRVKSKAGKFYYNQYVRHLEKTRAGRVIQANHHVKPVSKEEYDSRPKPYPSIVLSREDLDELRKLIDRFHKNRETSHAELLTKILNSIERAQSQHLSNLNDRLT